ncbi:MAG: glycosyltransferase [Rhodocyclaceae bacterium]|nr:glycosyltransferase [Rhodocyclaceae bacterium]
MRIACIIPTYNGREELIRLLDSLEGQTVSFDTFVIDSSSSDGTREVAEQRVGNVTVIAASAFNHGGTRQLMITYATGYDIYVYLTQDACLASSNAIAKLVEPFSNPIVGAVCGRQLPHIDASALAQHARRFNYPPESQIKCAADVPQLGLKATFMSNSFAAYRATALEQIGGFPVHVIFAEDSYVAAKMLMAGWAIAYAGDALCRHSHNYTIAEEFRRYFDMGVFHAREPWIRQNFGGAGGEGLRYVKSELKCLGIARMYLWPSSLLRNVLKLVAYKLGQQEQYLPKKLKRKISMYRRYWDGPFADERSPSSMV